MPLWRLACALVVALLFCGPPAAFGQNRPAMLSPYKIGLTYPLTGPFATNAQTYIPAIELAVDEINKKGGVNGHPLQLALEDTQATPAGGIEAMRKLVQVDGVQAVMTIYTNVLLAQVPLADQLRVPDLSPAEVPGVIEKSQYSFAHSSRLVNVMALVAGYWKTHNVKRVYALFSNNAQGQASSPVLRSMVEGFGGTFGDALVNLTDTDFRGIAARTKEFNADMILINMQGALAETTVIKQLREVGVTAPMVDPAIFYNSKYWRDGVGPYSEGMYFAGISVDPVVGRDFIRAYRKKVGYDPDYVCGEVYDMVHMLAYAIGKAGYNGPAIRDVLATLKDFPTVFGGTVSMQDDHRTLFRKVGFYQVRHGKLTPIPLGAEK
jgi:branched-chain amino acid transport system substrate-binding protein